MIINQGNTFLCASYCFAYALMDKFGIMLDVNWLPGMRQAFNATLDGHLHVLQAFGALPEGEYTLPPFPLRAQAQEWCQKNKTTLLKAATPYKVAEWRQVVTADELYDALGSGWYGVFIASQYHTEKHVGGYYYPYAGKDYAGAHAMSVWLKDGKLWVWNTRGPDWGDGGGAYIHDSDVLKGGECYIFRFEEDNGGKTMRETKYVTGIEKALIVRETADTKSAQVGYLDNAEQVIVLAEQDDRSLVATGVCGWVATKHLTDKPPDVSFPLPSDLPEPEDQNEKLQWYLHKWGFGPLVGEIDGKIGSKTKEATRQFQAAMGLTADGIAGTKTWAALTGEIIVPRITELDMACACGKYCDGYPNPCTTGVRILIERIWREVEKRYPGVMFYISNTAHPAPDGAIAGGQRCEKWNDLRGGANGSQHKKGTAADIYGRLDGVNNSVLRDYIEDVALRLNTKGGVGYGANHIVHVDIRGKDSRWEY